DVIIAGKLRAPGNPELAIGAVTEDGRVWLNEGVAAMSGADSEYVEMEKESRLAMVRDRLARYRAVKEKVDLADRTVIIADDGLATGSTMTAAIEAASAAGAKGIIVAVPGGPADTVERIGRMKEVLRVLCPLAPTAFYAVSQLYLDFTPVEDDTVIELLKGFSD
ncbi:MAG: phosphoribosyltransferase, partial [Thermodesulfobacteriota bacterium]